jgi:hypothetical protein
MRAGAFSPRFISVESPLREKILPFLPPVVVKNVDDRPVGDLFAAKGRIGIAIPRFTGIHVPIWNVKFMSCFISEQKGKDFFARGSPYSDGIAPVRFRFRRDVGRTETPGLIMSKHALI